MRYINVRYELVQCCIFHAAQMCETYRPHTCSAGPARLIFYLQTVYLKASFHGVHVQGRYFLSLYFNH